MAWLTKALYMFYLNNSKQQVGGLGFEQCNDFVKNSSVVGKKGTI